MNEDLTSMLSRLSLGVAGLAYVAVFAVAFQTGSAVEEALLKGGAAMLGVGALGLVGMRILRSSDEEAGRAAEGERIDVAALAALDEAKTGGVAAGGGR